MELIQLQASPMRFFILVIATVGLSSCASYFTRKSCEATNWFDYGQTVAMEGRRLTGDAFVAQCYEADADVAESDLDRGFKAGMEKYCKPEIVFQTGKEGRFFNPDMCAPEGMNNLKVRHREGVTEYCQRSNGYTAGAKGTAYNKICPAELEKAFLPEFNRGRKKYLNTLISQNEKQIRELDRDVYNLESDLVYRQRQLHIFQLKHGEQDPNTAAELGRLRSDVSTTQSQITSKRNQQNKLRARNREIEIEIVQLGE